MHASPLPPSGNLHSVCVREGESNPGGDNGHPHAMSPVAPPRPITFPQVPHLQHWPQHSFLLQLLRVRLAPGITHRPRPYQASGSRGGGGGGGVHPPPPRLVGGLTNRRRKLTGASHPLRSPPLPQSPAGARLLPASRVKCEMIPSDEGAGQRITGRGIQSANRAVPKRRFFVLLRDRPPITGSVAAQPPSVTANHRQLQATAVSCSSSSISVRPWGIPKSRVLEVFYFLSRGTFCIDLYIFISAFSGEFWVLSLDSHPSGFGPHAVCCRV